MESGGDFPRLRFQKKARRPAKSDEPGQECKRTEKTNDVFGGNEPRSDNRRNRVKKMISEGALGLGAVRMVKNTSVILECVDGIQVKLPAKNMGKTLVETLANGGASLSDVFTIGQMIAFKIMNVSNGKERCEKRLHTYAEVSCDPAVINAHISLANLRNGLVVNGAVESVEDKGIIVKLFATAEVKGFVPISALPATMNFKNLVEGQLLLLRVERKVSNKKDRVINLSAIPEAEWLTEEDEWRFELNHLMPGTLLRVNPTNANDEGVNVNIGNGVECFIHRRHLPERFRANPKRCVYSLRAVVMFCQQNSDLLVLNAHPDVVALSKASKRVNFENHQIGDVVQCKVNNVDKRGTVTFDLLTGDSKSSRITAYAKRRNLDSKAQYTVGSVYEVRVLSYRFLERDLLVTTKKNLMAQKMVAVEDAKPGEKVIAKVTAIRQFGVYVKIYGRISGFIPKSQLSDRLITKIANHLSVGKTLKCRILSRSSRSAENSQLILTRKPSLVNSKFGLITSYEEAVVGMETEGYIVRIHRSGGLTIGFYAGVTAFMLARDAVKVGDGIRLGLTVKVRVVSLKSESRPIFVEPIEVRSQIEQPVWPCPDLPVAFPACIENVFNHDAKARCDADCLLVRMRIPTTVERLPYALLPKNLTSDCLDLPFCSLENCFRKGAMLEITVLDKSNDMTKAVGKRFIINWLKNHTRIKTFDELERGQLVCGIITGWDDRMVYSVEIAGGSALTGRARFVHSNQPSSTSLKIGQTVVARVVSVNHERRRFSLVLDARACYPPAPERDTLGIELVRSALEELNWLAANNGAISSISPIGSLGEFVVEDIFLNGLLLSCANNLQVKGNARRENLTSGHYEKGDHLYGVVLWIDFAFLKLEVYVLGKLESSPRTNNRNLALSEIHHCNVRVCLLRHDYIVGITRAVIWPPLVIYIPTRSHPNIVASVQELENLAHEIASSLVALKDFVGQAIIGVKARNKRDVGEQRTSVVLPSLAMKPKPFGIYTAVVISKWKKGKMSCCAVELNLPGNHLGRLHASEMDDAFLERNKHPVEAFLKDFEGKLVNVKVISIGKVKEEKIMENRAAITVVHRVAECTMRSEKLAETKKKQSILDYPKDYPPGSVIPVFAIKGPHRGVVKVEISPEWDGVIHKQNLDNKHLVLNPSSKNSSLIDYEFSPGEKLLAKVIGMGNVKKGRTRSRRRKCLELTLIEHRKTFSPMDRVFARVISQMESPTRVIFELCNSQRAVLSATGVTDTFSQSIEALRTYKLNEICVLHLLQFDEEKGHWIAITEALLNSMKENCNRVYTKAEDIKKNTVVKAFVVSKAPNGAFFAEISPVIIARIERNESEMELQLDDLIKVRVKYLQSDGKLNVAYISTIQRNISNKTDCKEIQKRVRRASTFGDGTEVKNKKLRKVNSISEEAKENSVQPKVVELMPRNIGLDWSFASGLSDEYAELSNFGKHDLVTVEKEGEAEEGTTLNGSQKEEIENLKTLAKRESCLVNEGDFDLMVANTPNSSLSWIRFISFFLEQNDVERARAVAERALTTIDFRKENEVFSVWTAYLNLEVNYGSAETLKAVFDRAVRNTDALKMHKLLFMVHKRKRNFVEADALLDSMLKRFRLEDLEIWFMAGRYYLETERGTMFRNLIQKALCLLPASSHVMVLSRFAVLEYNFGDIEQGKTFFETILNSYPKKTNVWAMYIDLTIKFKRIDEARSLFERVTALPLSLHKMRLFFEKWTALEQEHGDAEHLLAVKRRALHCIEKLSVNS